MEFQAIPFINGGLKRYWRRRRYQRLDGTASTGRRNLKIVRFGEKSSNRRFWKIRVIPKLRLKSLIASPMKLLGRLRDGYVNMMLGLVGNVGSLNNESSFGTKRIPKAWKIERSPKSEDVEMKLVVEIYKYLMASQESSDRA